MAKDPTQDDDASLSTLAQQLSISNPTSFSPSSSPPPSDYLCGKLTFCALTRNIHNYNPASHLVFYISRDLAALHYTLAELFYEAGNGLTWAPFRTVEFLAARVNVHFQLDHTDPRCYSEDGQFRHDIATQMDAFQVMLFIKLRLVRLIKGIVVSEDGDFPAKYTTEDFHDNFATLLTGSMVAVGHMICTAQGHSVNFPEELDRITEAIAVRPGLLKDISQMPSLFYSPN